MTGINMRFLVIGLGSMGKRRIRNLKALGITHIYGFDVRQDRKVEAQNLFGIKTISDINSFQDFDAAVISTAPDGHNAFIRMMIEHQKPCFVELSLLLQDLPDLLRQAEKNRVFIAPSCTFRFHPSVRCIKDIVHSGRYGKVQNFSYHTGQYLPDWHPWENINDFFVSRKDTSGCKEILSLELHWLLDTLGNPLKFHKLAEKTLFFKADIDDSYAITLKFSGFTGVMMVDIISRFATRSLILNLQSAQIRWNWEDGVVRLYDAEQRKWSIAHESRGQAHEGYNSNLIEEMYIDEMKAFVDAVRLGTDFPHSLEKDIEVLRFVEAIDADTSSL